MMSMMSNPYEIGPSTDEVIKKIVVPFDVTKVCVIFYDVELNETNEGRADRRAYHVGQDLLFVHPHEREDQHWNKFAEKPERTIERFIQWGEHDQGSETVGDPSETRVVLAAHYGSCHDHLHLIRMMMTYGFECPNYVFADTLALFKMMKGMNTESKLSDLRDTYTPWITHTPHDADSNALVLRHVTIIAFPETIKMVNG
ncbi:hypothetical protein PG994_015198, partial [Apiospora phragmitis]